MASLAGCRDSHTYFCLMDDNEPPSGDKRRRLQRADSRRVVRMDQVSLRSAKGSELMELVSGPGVDPDPAGGVKPLLILCRSAAPPIKLKPRLQSERASSVGSMKSFGMARWGGG